MRKEGEWGKRQSVTTGPPEVSPVSSRSASSRCRRLSALGVFLRFLRVTRFSSTYDRRQHDRPRRTRNCRDRCACRKRTKAKRSVGHVRFDALCRKSAATRAVDFTQCDTNVCLGTTFPKLLRCYVAAINKASCRARREELCPSVIHGIRFLCE